ncbi:CAP domain-containing protein [Psychromarinibacter sp. C21-152]|uniref:CAP domain-containing protein n=1 Tax=Psychromarinibacter sediminicola TaxID=3033385 RepID=A0AAE3T9Z8_9RHOB|nr:CAP domain-containing protein [Psychromarinibacter sediminicola]MDF0602333.1 CAP domain-containing protein [Psychromarinibacter sediminicola]
MHRRALLTAALAVVATPAAAQETCPRPDGGDAAAEALLDGTNALRRGRGLPALSVSGPLKRAAQRHSCHMARSGRMSHTGRGGSTVGDRATAAGYRWRFIAENVAEGYPTAEAVLDGWQGSSGHRANLLAPEARDIGIGLAEGDGRRYWTMVLGAPRG